MALLSFILEEVSTETQSWDGTPYKPWPKVQSVIDEAFGDLLHGSPWLAQFSEALRVQTGEALVRRIDHLALPAGRYAQRLADVGFTINDAANANEARAQHPNAFVPPIYLRHDAQARCAIAVESVEAFVASYPNADRDAPIEGAEGSPSRRCQIANSPSVDVWVAERWGATPWDLDDRSVTEREDAARHLQAFRSRPRNEGPASTMLGNLFRDLRENIRQAIDDLDPNWAAALFFRAEREHWVAQTPAAQVQAHRQDAWGLGWANHDHHTYRCSRVGFAETIAVLELLGLVPREAFHAGAEAGWGAQVLEHPELPFVAFADVDLSPSELTNDFARSSLAPQDTLGTVGLWCGLHGEAMFGAGLHHLACYFDFDALPAQLYERAIEVMPSFTDLPELRQAFTVASLRPVAPERLDALRRAGLITTAQAETFARQGALGSHIEIIERRQAYKGFHQQGINSIITGTDPRR